MHMETVEVAAGDNVTMGQRLGSVGRTGMMRSSPHLHLEIKSDKRRYDAREFVPNILIGEPPHERGKRKRLV